VDRGLGKNTISRRYLILLVLVIGWIVLVYFTLEIVITFPTFFFLGGLLLFFYMWFDSMYNSWRLHSIAWIDSTPLPDNPFQPTGGHSSICPQYDMKFLPAQYEKSSEKKMTSPSLVVVAKGGITYLMNLAGGRSQGFVICRPEHIEQIGMPPVAYVCHANLFPVPFMCLPQHVQATIKGMHYTPGDPLWLGLTSTIDMSATPTNLDFERLYRNAEERANIITEYAKREREYFQGALIAQERKRYIPEYYSPPPSPQLKQREER